MTEGKGTGAASRENTHGENFSTAECSPHEIASWAPRPVISPTGDHGLTEGGAGTVDSPRKLAKFAKFARRICSVQIFAQKNFIWAIFRHAIEGSKFDEKFVKFPPHWPRFSFIYLFLVKKKIVLHRSSSAISVQSAMLLIPPETTCIQVTHIHSPSKFEDKFEQSPLFLPCQDV